MPAADLERTKVVLRKASIEARGTVRLSMVMIAKNEEHNIDGCFASFWDHVDEVVLCDTGSTDRTVQVAQEFAAEHPGPDLIVGHFEWCDDFAAARNYADSLATGDWLIWCDLDDRTVGGEYLRGLAALAPKGLQGCRFLWATGDVLPVGCDDQYEISVGSHSRMVRNNGSSAWICRCAEFRYVRGATDYVCSRIAYWAHPKWEKIASPYYRQLWRQMTDDNEPMAYWAWLYLTLAAFETKDFPETVECAGRFLEIVDAECFYRPGVAIRQVMALGNLQETEDALAAAWRSYDEWPRSSIARMGMLQAYGYAGSVPGVLKWADEVLALGAPRRSWLDPYAPEFYVWYPRKLREIARRQAVLDSYDRLAVG